MKTEERISEIMTRRLVTIRPTETLSRVNAIFQKHNFHHIPVVENGNRLVGIVSKEDLLKIYRRVKTREAWDDLDGLPVSNFMTANPVTIDPDDTIGLAGDIILTNLFHSLPVVEDGRLVGIVTSLDVLKAMVSVISEDDMLNQELPETYQE